MQIPRYARSVFEHAVFLVYTSSNVMIAFQKMSFFSKKCLQSHWRTPIRPYSEVLRDIILARILGGLFNTVLKICTQVIFQNCIPKYK